MNVPTHLPSLLTSSLLLLLLLPFSSTEADPATQSNGTDTGTNNALDMTYIRNSCGATLYPDVCYQALSRYAGSVRRDPARLAKAAMALSLSRARRLSSYLSNATGHADYGSDRRASAALHDCVSNLADAIGEIRDSVRQMRQLGSSVGEEFRFLMSNVQTWMSAALTDEETCTDGFEDVSDGQLKVEVSDRVDNVKKYTSNALALVNSYVNSKSN